VKKILEISEKAAKEQRKSFAAQLQMLGRRRGGGGGRVPKSARTPRTAKVPPPVDGEGKGEKKAEEVAEESGSPAESAEDTKKSSSESANKDQDKEKKRTHKLYRGGKKSINAKSKQKEGAEKATDSGADNADDAKEAEEKAPVAAEATTTTKFTTEYNKLDRGEAPAPVRLPPSFL
jgi:hypothetical protein